MKRVLILTTISGFLTQFEMNDASILEELGYELHYASNFHNPVYKINKKDLEKKGIKLHHIDIEKSPVHIISNLKAFWQICKIIKSEQIQLLHCHNPIGGVLGRLAAFFCHQQIQVVYTAHGFHFYHRAPIWNWLIFYPVEVLLAKITDCLITINEEDYKRASSFSLKKGGWTVKIPGVGVRTEKFQKRHNKRKQVRKKLGIGDEIFYILSVGEINKNKNHEIVLRAIAELKDPNVHYGICGQGKRGQYLKNLAEELGIEKQFTMFGFRSDIANMLQCADCFAFPSKREGLGIAAIEAMAGGIPLITSDCRGTREYMEHGVTGYVCAGDRVEEYVSAIIHMRENKKRNEQMSYICAERAKKFDLSVTDQIMRHVYERLTGTALH